ncbi:MAG: hypothetical protein J6Q84_07145 [Kiritimatiellae bacterium]|nr:hypothetical protein [Kiritimatiellia bacterium]
MNSKIIDTLVQNSSSEDFPRNNNIEVYIVDENTGDVYHFFPGKYNMVRTASEAFLNNEPHLKDREVRAINRTDDLINLTSTFYLYI